MALGKLGAFLNRDLGTLAKDAGKMLNADVGSLAKGAGQLLQSDLGELLRDAPPKPVEKAPAIAALSSPAPATAAKPFDAQATQKIIHTPLSEPPAAASASFDPDATQRMNAVTVVERPRPAADEPATSAPAAPVAPTKFNQDLLFRTQLKSPVGTEIKVLLPYTVADFERPRATPAGELTNDPVTAVYSCKGESVTVLLALCWDEDEAKELVEDAIKRIGQAARTTADRNWVIGPTPQGVVFAWVRGCYFYCATSPKGAPALARFLTDYEY